MKKVINLILIILLITALTGCEGDKVKFPNGITTTEFSDDVLSFKFPDTYKVINIYKDYNYFDHKQSSSFFYILLNGKLDLSLEEMATHTANTSIEQSRKLGMELQLDKTEDLKIDGKDAKLLTFKGGLLDERYILIDYDSVDFYLFLFCLEFDEDNTQLIQAILASVKFK